tara:strand:- start:105 stop:749 length:645 start_codon:yes stop_codon:yes gene_type:complete
MKNSFRIFLLILSTFLIQNKAFSYSKNTGKMSVSVSVNKIDRPANKNTDSKTNASVSKSIESINSSGKDNTAVSKTAEKPSVKDTSNEKSYSYDDNNSSSDDNYDRNNNFGNKVDGYKSSRKYEIAKQESLLDAIKNFKNEESLSKGDLKRIDSLVNKRIREIVKKIKFKFDKDDEKRFFEFTEKKDFDIEIIEKKAELVDYVQKTFEVMGLIN